MRSKREKGYWVKRTERYTDAKRAKDRAGSLRLHEHISHVTVERKEDGFEVSYSVAQWYLDDLKGAGIAL